MAYTPFTHEIWSRINALRWQLNFVYVNKARMSNVLYLFSLRVFGFQDHIVKQISYSKYVNMCEFKAARI